MWFDGEGVGGWVENCEQISPTYIYNELPMRSSTGRRTAADTMNTTIFVTWNASKEQPLTNIIIDEKPLFDISVFDYSGSLAKHQQSSSVTIKSGSWERRCTILSGATEGKGEILKSIANNADNTQSSYIGIFDDDILIRVSDINRAVLIGEQSGFASFQPSLAKCSHYSYEFTLNQQGTMARIVPWVEIMMPIIKTKLLMAAKPFLGSNISSWGLDCYVLPMLALTEKISGHHAVIDASIASHLRKVSSGDKIYHNGLTASQEMMVTKSACKQYLAHKGIQLDECDALRELLAF